MARPGRRTEDGDEVIVRVEVPPAVLGLTPPPQPLNVQALRVRGSVVLLFAFVEPGGADADHWLAGLRLGPVGRGPGGRIARIDLAGEPPVWAALLDGVTYHHLFAPPHGPVTATLRGPRHRVQRLVEEVLCAGPAAGRETRVRSVQSGEPSSLLTERQRQALLAAHRAGYYQLPRPVNLRALANDLGISPPALSELLRRAEGAIIDAYVSGAMAPLDPALRRDPPGTAPGPRGVASRTPPAGPAGDRRPRRASR